MSKMIKDKRLFNIHNLTVDDNVFEYFDLQDVSDEKPYLFVNALDHVKGGRFGHRQTEEDIQNLLSEIEEYLDEYKDDDWLYAERVLHEYDTCYLSSPVFEQCDRILKADEEVWFAWVDSIEFTGIQCLFLHFIKSIQCLISFLGYLQQHPVKTKQREYLITLLLHTFLNYLNRIDNNIQVARVTGQKNDSLDAAKWNEEANSYISKFVTILFDLPEEQYQNVIYSMLSHIWVYDEKRNKFLKRVRNKIIDVFVTHLHMEEEVKVFLKDSRLELCKSAVYHKLLVYLQWALQNDQVSQYCQDLLWEQLIVCLETQGTYLYYHQEDDQLFSWVCAKLLADETEPIKRIEAILSRYHHRFDGWNTDKFENIFQRGRAFFFFLTVGAMSSEWLLREDRKDTADKMIRFIFTEGQIALDNIQNDSDDELNYLQQSWARVALFMRKETTNEYTQKILNALDMINTIEYRLTAIHVFLMNLDQHNKGTWFKDTFRTGIVDMLKTDLVFLNHRSTRLEKEINMLKEKIRDIMMILQSEV